MQTEAFGSFRKHGAFLHIPQCGKEPGIYKRHLEYAIYTFVSLEYRDPALFMYCMRERMTSLDPAAYLCTRNQIVDHNRRAASLATMGSC